MLINTNAIVLTATRFKDHSLIVKCYTKDYGIKSYILHHIFKSKKGKINNAYFQLLSQIEIQANHKTNQSLHTINEVKLHHPYTSLHTNIYKSTVALFLAEVLQTIIQEEEENQDLYYFLESALLWYDLNEFNANFHLLFLLKLSQHLGIFPNTQNLHHYFFTKESTLTKINLLKQLIGINFDTLNDIKMNAKIRQEILQEILQYFDVHLGSFKKPKSLEILHKVFN